MLRFRGLILPLLTPSDWHGEWRRRPEAELAWLRGLGPPPSPALPPGQAPVSTPSYLFMVGAELVGITADSTRHDTLPCIYTISTLYLHYIYSVYLNCAGPGWRGFPGDGPWLAPPTPRPSTGKMARPERDLMQPWRSDNQKECPQFCGTYVTRVIYYKCGYINRHL